jgi:hypothetical protein
MPAAAGSGTGGDRVSVSLAPRLREAGLFQQKYLVWLVYPIVLSIFYFLLIGVFFPSPFAFEYYPRRYGLRGTECTLRALFKRPRE